MSLPVPIPLWFVKLLALFFGQSKRANIHVRSGPLIFLLWSFRVTRFQEELVVVSGTSSCAVPSHISGRVVYFICLLVNSLTPRRGVIIVNGQYYLGDLVRWGEETSTASAGSDVDVICFGLSVEMNFVFTSSEIYFPVTVKLQSQNWRIYWEETLDCNQGRATVQLAVVQLDVEVNTVKSI